MSDLITKNKVVYFTYVVTDEMGQVTEQSDIPFGYIHGVAGVQFEFLPALEKKLENKKVGDRIEVRIEPEDGFGFPDKNLIYRDKMENVPEEFRTLGAEAEFKNDDGESRNFVVTDVSEGMVTLDGNHPYAGKVVIFIVTLLDVRDAEPEELVNGRPKDVPPAVIH